MTSSTINLEENLTVRDWYEESQGYYGSTATNMVCYDNGTNIRGPYALPSCTVSNIRIKVDPSDTGIYVRGCIYKKVNGVATAILMGVGSWKQLSSSGAQVVDCPCSIFLPNSGNYYIGWSSSGVVGAISWLGYPSWDGKTSYFRNGYPDPFGTPSFTDSTITFVARVTYRVPSPPTFVWTRVKDLNEDLDLQDSFWRVNPFLLEGWESNTFTENGWTKYNSPTLVQTPVHHGGYSLKADETTSTYNGVVKTFTARTTLSTRFFVYFPSLPSGLTSGELVYVGGVGSPLRIQTSPSSRWVVSFSGITYLTQPVLQAGRWYIIEIKLWQSGLNCNIKIWIDEQLRYQNSVVFSTSYSDIRFGHAVSSGASLTYYVDDIALDSVLIGSNFDPVGDFGRFCYQTLSLNGIIGNPRWKYLLESLHTFQERNISTNSFAQVGIYSQCPPYRARMVRTSDGTVHYAHDLNNLGGVYHFYSRNNGKSWSTSTLVVSSKGEPCMTRDGNDNLLIIYRAASTIYFKKATVNKGVNPWTWTWGTERTIGSTWPNAIVCDSNNYYHVWAYVNTSTVGWYRCTDGQGIAWTYTPFTNTVANTSGGFVVDSQNNLYGFNQFSNGVGKVKKLTYEGGTTWTAGDWVTFLPISAQSGIPIMLPDDRIMYVWWNSGNNYNYVMFSGVRDVSSWSTYNSTSLGTSQSYSQMTAFAFSKKKYRVYYWRSNLLKYRQTNDGGKTWATEVSESTAGPGAYNLQSTPRGEQGFFNVFFNVTLNYSVAIKAGEDISFDFSKKIFDILTLESMGPLFTPFLTLLQTFHLDSSLTKRSLKSIYGSFILGDQISKTSRKSLAETISGILDMLRKRSLKSLRENGPREVLEVDTEG